jgi:hypothetical protein
MSEIQEHSTGSLKIDVYFCTYTEIMIKWKESPCILHTLQRTHHGKAGVKRRRKPSLLDEELSGTACKRGWCLAPSTQWVWSKKTIILSYYILQEL